MSDVDDKPFMIEIPLPRQYKPAKNRGIESTNGPHGCYIQCRGTEFEKDRIKEAAEFLGISYGMFMRNVVNAATARVLELKAKA